MKQITTSAPGKLMLFGEHAVVYGHPCIVTAVNQRIRVTVKKNGTNIFRMDAPDIGLTAYSKTMGDLGKKDLPKEVQFVERLYKRFLEKYPQDEGIDVVTRSDFAATFGFGSSSAVTVAFAKALTVLYEIEVGEMELFAMCHRAVLDVQGVGSGFDIASAIWGKTIYYVPPAREVRVIDIDSIPLLVGYTGIKADTPTLVRVVEQLKAEDPEMVAGVFDRISEIVNEAEGAIVRRDWLKVGKLMNQNQDELRKLQISSVELENLIKATIKGGACGAKLSGAGGGDCMIGIVNKEDKKKVNEKLTLAGGKVLVVELAAEGVRVER